jgi:hypothetical protein
MRAWSADVRTRRGSTRGGGWCPVTPSALPPPAPSWHHRSKRRRSRSQPLCLATASPREPGSLLEQSVALFGAGAVLGPLLDHQHSRFDVLHYEHPLLLRLPPDLVVPDTSYAPWLRSLVDAFFVRESAGLETAPWVPVLFGTAAVIIGLGHTLGDDAVLARQQAGAGSGRPPGSPRTGYEPSWSAVALAITAFVLQYALSGALCYEHPAWLEGTPGGRLDALLAGLAFAIYAAVDGTEQGLVVAAASALAGPLAELGLINVLHLYHYTAPQWHGIPTWIPWVYFAGAPPVGALCRAVRARIRRQRARQEAALKAVAQRALPAAAVTSPFASASAAAKQARLSTGPDTAAPLPETSAATVDAPPPRAELLPPAKDASRGDAPAALPSADVAGEKTRAPVSRGALRDIAAAPAGPLREALLSSARERIDTALGRLASTAQDKGLTAATERWLERRRTQLVNLRRTLAGATQQLSDGAAPSPGDRVSRADADTQQVLDSVQRRVGEVEALLVQYMQAAPKDAQGQRAAAIGMRMLRAELADLSATLRRLSQ